MKYLLDDKRFYKTLFILALPIALQNLVSASLNMVDTIMIGRLGEVEIAAVGQANQLFFLFALFLFGINSGSAIFTAQFWGQRDVKNIRRVLGIALVTASAAAVVFSILAIVFPKQVMTIYSSDSEVIALGVDYLRIVGLSYIVTAISFSYASVLRSTEQPMIPMMCSIASLVTNTFLNYLFIFGKGGFPMMGVKGAAIATLIARLVEVGLMITCVYVMKLTPAASLKEMFDLSRGFIKKFYWTTAPVILNESLWSLGVTIYSVIYGRIGTGAVAAVNISGTIERIGMVLFHGMANAAAIMIGNRIGAGDEDKAYGYAKKLLTLGPLFGIFMGLILALSSGFVVSFFKVSVEVGLAAKRVLMILGLIMSVKIFNLINIVGVLRSGGDTKFSLFLDTVGIWLIGIPLAFIGGILLRLPVYWVILMVAADEVFKVSFGVKRFLSKKWINNLAGSLASTKDDGVQSISDAPYPIPAEDAGVS